MLTTPPLSLRFAEKMQRAVVVHLVLLISISFSLSLLLRLVRFFISFGFIRNRFRFWQNNLFVLLQFFSLVIFVCLFVSLHIFVFSFCSTNRILPPQWNTSSNYIVRLSIATTSLSFVIKTQYNFHRWKSNVCSLLTLINAHF